MAKANTHTDSGIVNEQFTTGVFHDGREVAVRARSKYSRSKHEPVTADDGSVVWYAPTERDEPGPAKIVDADHDDAEPRPACGLPCGDVDEVDFMLSGLEGCVNRPACSYCNGTNGDPSTGSANKSFARIMRYGRDWGE